MFVSVFFFFFFYIPCKSFFKYFNNEFIEQNLIHNHNYDSEKIINRQVLNNKLKRKAQDEIYKNHKNNYILN